MFGYSRHYWTDKRFAGKFSETLRLKGSIIEGAWIPDTYVTNTRESNLMAENSDVGSVFEIHPNGTIFYSRRLVLIPLWISGVSAILGFLSQYLPILKRIIVFIRTQEVISTIEMTSERRVVGLITSRCSGIELLLRA